MNPDAQKCHGAPRTIHKFGTGFPRNFRILSGTFPHANSQGPRVEHVQQPLNLEGNEKVIKNYSQTITSSLLK